MKAMLHGFPSPFITIDGHYEIGEIFTWMDGSEYEVYKCDPIGENPNGQLQNVYVKRKENK